MIILLIGTRMALYGGEFIFIFSILLIEDDPRFRLPSFSEAVDSQTGDQDGQLFLVVSSGADENSRMSKGANLLRHYNQVRGGHCVLLLSVFICFGLLPWFSIFDRESTLGEHAFGKMSSGPCNCSQELLRLCSFKSSQ